ncbi:P-loop containing nucleoside triphosphate hydrolase protein [Aspergillus pseudoustus]|uniref:ATP-dependent DNA helicase n=1 Tax=Aspergillus pseudoustus TaxID=1810923 RepID=A0ABR4KKQ0_9EURO
MDISLPRRKVDLDFYLHRVFQKQSFRPLQRDVITAAIEGHDVFLQASTSFGKSLCFQLPAMTRHGVTVVVCPLLSLMTDQVNALEALGVPVAMINSNTPFEERRVILNDLLSGHPRTRLLYVTPELCQTDTFRRNLKTIHRQRELVRIAIDEAHCISEWGHNFRPAYKDLAWFKAYLTDPPVPITALTATATPQVRKDIIKILGLDPPRLKIFSTPSTRPNIHYEIRFMQGFAPHPTEPESFQIKDLLTWLHSVQARRDARCGANIGAIRPPILGIIYVSTRIASTKLAETLCRRDSRIRAVAYHAGLSTADRTRVQNEWIMPQEQQRHSTDGNPRPDTLNFYIIVATAAFGMGIDNPQVRFVVHWSPPRTFEGFVQESGRAGRDGRAAASIVYYNPQERERVLEWLRRDIENVNNRTGGRTTGLHNRNKVDSLRNLYARKQSFEKVVQYCETTTECRHKMIRDFFGDSELERMGSQVPVKPGYDADIKTENVGDWEDAPGGVPLTSPCDWACDFCKEGPKALAERKQKIAPDSGLAPFSEAGPSWLEVMFLSINRMFPMDRIFPELRHFA